MSFSSIAGVKEHSLLCDNARKAAKSFTKKDHFRSHLRDVHTFPDATDNTTNWTFQIDSSWPRRCGLCGDHHKSWNDRAQHIVENFKSGIKIDKWTQTFENTKQNLSDVSHTQSATEGLYTTEGICSQPLQPYWLKESDPNIAISRPSPSNWIALATERGLNEKQYRRTSYFNEDMPWTLQTYLHSEGEVYGIHTNVEPDERSIELSNYSLDVQSDKLSFHRRRHHLSEGISDENEILGLDHRNTVPTLTPRGSTDVRWQRLTINGRSHQHTEIASLSRHNIASLKLRYELNSMSQGAQENNPAFLPKIAPTNISNRPRGTLLSRTKQWTKSVITKPKSWFGHTSPTQPETPADLSFPATSTIEANAHFQSPFPSLSTFSHSNAPQSHSYNAKISSPHDADDLLLRMNEMTI